MSNQNLYLIQSGYQQTLHVLEKLSTVAGSNDAVVLMGDAVLHAQHTHLHHLSCYILENEIALLGTAAVDIKALSYAEFADLCLQYQRCITLR